MKINITINKESPLADKIFEISTSSFQSGIFYFYSISIKATEDISRHISNKWVITQKRKDTKGIFYFVLMPIEWYIFSISVPLTVSDKSKQTDNIPSVQATKFTEILKDKDITLSPSVFINSLAKLILDENKELLFKNSSVDIEKDLGLVTEEENNMLSNLFDNSNIKININESVNTLIVNTKYINIIEIVNTIYRGIGFCCVQSALGELTRGKENNKAKYIFLNIYKPGSSLSYNGTFEVFSVDVSNDFTRLANNVVFGMSEDGSIRPINPVTDPNGFDVAIMRSKVENLQYNNNVQSTAIGDSYNMIANIGLLSFFDLEKVEALPDESVSEEQENSKLIFFDKKKKLKKANKNKELRNVYVTKLLEYLSALYSYQNRLNSFSINFQGAGDIGVGTFISVNDIELTKTQMENLQFNLLHKKSFLNKAGSFIVTNVNYTMVYNSLHTNNEEEKITMPIGNITCVYYDGEQFPSLDKIARAGLSNNNVVVEDEKYKTTAEQLKTKQKSNKNKGSTQDKTFEEQPLTPEEGFGTNPALAMVLASLFANWIKNTRGKIKKQKNKKPIKTKAQQTKKTKKIKKAKKSILSKAFDVLKKLIFKKTKF